MTLPQEIIRKKRDGLELNRADIEQFIDGVANFSISDGQIAALSMAIVLQGMTKSETVALIQAIVDTGMVMDWSLVDLNGPVIDGITTGGVGDKGDLIYAPVIAACGGYVPMMAGRGLHHTGGTVDKMESIPGYNSKPDTGLFRQTVKDTGCAITGPSPKLTSANQRIYPIRDVTATVSSIPLITASIISKKIAAGVKDALVIDVKVGNGTFAQTMDEAERLARALVLTSSETGLPTTAIISDMNQVLGRSVGNALEVTETINFLTGKHRDKQLNKIVQHNCAEALVLGKLANNTQDAAKMVQTVLDNGKAAEHFARMVHALEGPANIIEQPEKYLPQAPVVKPVFTRQSGYVKAMNTRWFGLTAVQLGAGRMYLAQKIDYSVGFSRVRAIGEEVNSDIPFAFVHAANEDDANKATENLLGAVEIGQEPATPPPAIYQTLHT